MLRFICALLIGLTTAFSVSAAERLHVVTTTAHLADVAAGIGGERVRAESLFGPGVDPHLYKPARSDMARLLAADLVLASGLHLEAQFDSVFAQVERAKPVVLVGDRLDAGRLLESEDYPGRHDPHIWMDPALWSGVVDIVRDTLIEHDPEGRTVYEAGAQAYQARIAEFASYARTAMEGIAPERRVLVTAHDAFAYFGRAFGVEVMGIQGMSTESEAGLRRIEQLAAMLAERKLSAVFVESSVPQANIRALVEGARARGHGVEIGGELYSDALGAPGTYEGTWLGMIDHNVTTISRARRGRAGGHGGVGRAHGRDRRAKRCRQVHPRQGGGRHRAAPGRLRADIR